jgi:site-specific DNA-methyltransferase (adenine-specific)
MNPTTKDLTLPDPYYEDAWVKLYHGRCEDVLPLVGPADLTLTDPPFNVGKKYGGHDDSMEPAEYREWLRSVFFACPTPAIVYTPGIANVYDAPQVLPYPIRWTLGWHKKEFAGDLWTAGPAHCWEPIVWASQEPKPFFNKTFGTLGRDFLVVNATHGDLFKGAGRHPCPKPLPVMEWLVGLFASEGGTVLDPFAGSGTTLYAARMHGRKAIGIEREERFCDLAAERLAQQRLPLEGGIAA